MNPYERIIMHLVARIALELVRFMVGLAAAILADKLLGRLWNAGRVRLAR
jgi:hypothetical protein